MSLKSALVGTPNAGVFAVSCAPAFGAAHGQRHRQPCVSLCQLNGELCVSCGRTREEIRKWRGMKRPEKMATVQRAVTRLKAIVKKGAKRQARD